ncbi:hypothetical protein BM1_03668 [Bipolaris maydis]|nr:hypothetical protein BM1_03668 [Bipolaris maydis]
MVGKSISPTQADIPKCFYHPNPMTKPAGTPRKKPESRRRKLEAQSINGQGRLASLTLSPPTLRNDADPGAVSNTWPTPPEPAIRTPQNVSHPARNFFLGSTSYASVFTGEHPLPTPMDEESSERPIPTSPVPTRSIGHRHCQFALGNLIVSSLSPFSFFEKSLTLFFETQKTSPIVGPLILSALPQLRKDMELLKSADNDVYPLYAEMTRNTARPMKVPAGMRPAEFHTLFTGKNLRWETLGLVLVLAGFKAQFTAPNDPMFALEGGEVMKKDEFIEDVMHATNVCINICQTHGAVNEIMVCLVYINMLVVSNYYGDNREYSTVNTYAILGTDFGEDHGTWRRMGDSVSALYAAGIHCEASSSEGENCEPFFMREFRRRLYAAIYRSDKTLAVFYGRPPLMGWRYSDRKMLLDISDQAIISEDANVLSAELSKLDGAGWNTEGFLNPATFVRLSCQLSVFKERLLEQSLAGEKDSEVVRNIEAISAECAEWWHALPAYLRYETYTDDSAWNVRGPGVAVRLIACYLDYLHLEFQTQRLLHKITQQALPALLEVSLKLLATSIVSTMPNNRVYETRRHFPTVVLFYCFPAAGVIALELRRCTIEGVPLPSTISRADVIRNLSILTSCLEWIILPGDGNHRLCSELNKMLAVVLDEVLNYEPPVNRNQESGEDAENMLAGAGQGILDMPMIEGLEPIPTEAEDFLNWLDNATWNGAVS